MGCHRGPCKSLCRALALVPRVPLTVIPILAVIQLWTSGQPVSASSPQGSQRGHAAWGGTGPHLVLSLPWDPCPLRAGSEPFGGVGSTPPQVRALRCGPATRNAGNQSLGSQEAMRTGPRLEARPARGSLEGEAAEPGGGTGQTQLWPRLQGRGRESDVRGSGSGGRGPADPI